MNQYSHNFYIIKTEKWLIYSKSKYIDIISVIIHFQLIGKLGDLHCKSITVNMETIIKNITTLDIYPDLESNKLEFKSNLAPGDKLLPTFCAFMNSGGGHVICGIDDNTHAIKGIDKSTKEIDEFLLNIDTIYHVRKIVTNTFAQLTFTNIQTTLIKQKNGKPVIIISINPCPNTQYQISDGNIYYRVNASNWRINSTPMYTEFEMQSKVNHVRSLIMKDCRNLITYLQNQVVKSKVENENLNNENNKLQNLLFTRILEEKTECEKEETEDTINISFCCGIINFLFR